MRYLIIALTLLGVILAGCSQLEEIRSKAIINEISYNGRVYEIPKDTDIIFLKEDGPRFYEFERDYMIFNKEGERWDVSEKILFIL